MIYSMSKQRKQISTFDQSSCNFSTNQIAASQILLPYYIDDIRFDLNRLKTSSNFVKLCTHITLVMDGGMDIPGEYSNGYR